MHRELLCYETDHKLVHTRVFQSAMYAMFDGLYGRAEPEELMIRNILCHTTLQDENIIRPEVALDSLRDVPMQDVPMLCAPLLVLAIDAKPLPKYYGKVQEHSQTFLQEFFILQDVLRAGGRDARFDDILPEAKRPFAAASERLARSLMKLPFKRDNTLALFKEILPYNIDKIQARLCGESGDKEALRGDLLRLKMYYFVLFRRPWPVEDLSGCAA